LGEKGVGDRVVAEAAVFFVFGEVTDADLGEVLGVALIDLLEREVFFLDVVYAGLHVLAVVNGGGDDRTSLARADTKLTGGGFVVGNEETVADTGAIGDVEEDGAVVIWRENGETARVPNGSCWVARSALASMRLRKAVSW